MIRENPKLILGSIALVVGRATDLSKDLLQILLALQQIKAIHNCSFKKHCCFHERASCLPWYPIYQAKPCAGRDSTFTKTHKNLPVELPREAVYKTLPRVGQPRPTSGYASLKQKLAASKDVLPLSSNGFDLLLIERSSSASAGNWCFASGRSGQLSGLVEADTSISNSQGRWRTAHRGWHCSRSDAEGQQASPW